MRDIRRHLQAHRPDLAMRLLGYWKRSSQLAGAASGSGSGLTPGSPASTT
jgi:hypothetical protein